MRPMIGILSRPIVSETGRKMFGTYREVSDVILKFGGTPIQLFPPNIKEEDNLSKEEKEELHRVLDLCDGILLQGGSDFYPYDLEVANYTRINNIPTLGICLGMQIMGVAANGKMSHVKDKNTHQSKLKYTHDVLIESNSKLYQIFKTHKIQVNSRHQDCLSDTALDIVAYSKDHIIEAIEDKTKDFYIGVQWHPESMVFYDFSMDTLFQHFFDSFKRK